MNTGSSLLPHQVEHDLFRVQAAGVDPLLAASLGYRNGQINLTHRVFKQLTSVRASKAHQIESCFRNIPHHTQPPWEDVVSSSLALPSLHRGLQEAARLGWVDPGAPC